MEEIKKVKMVKVDYKCPKCENGYLRPTEIMYPTNPPQYPHMCYNCSYSMTFQKTYPYIDYINDENNEKND